MLGHQMDEPVDNPLPIEDLSPGDARLVADNVTIASRVNIRKTGVAFNLDGQLDGQNGADTNPYRAGMGITTVNGKNVRGGVTTDAITSDIANGAGSAFYAPFYVNSTFDDKGSMTFYTGYLTVSEVGAGGVYGEGMTFYGSVTSQRTAALTSGIEVQNIITAGKPARGTAGNFIVTENNALAAYSAANFGASSAWLSTGSRIVDAVSNGSQPVGVGYHARGDMLVCFRATATSSGRQLLQAFVGTGANPLFNLGIGGVFQWGAGGASPVDTDMFRLSPGTLKTGGMFIAGGGIGVGNSAAATTPGAVVKKIQVFDATGASIGFLPVYSSIT
jgi:hypothetical protein